MFYIRVIVVNIFIALLSYCASGAALPGINTTTTDVNDTFSNENVTFPTDEYDNENANSPNGTVLTVLETGKNPAQEVHSKTPNGTDQLTKTPDPLTDVSISTPTYETKLASLPSNVFTNVSISTPTYETTLSSLPSTGSMEIRNSNPTKPGDGLSTTTPSSSSSKISDHTTQQTATTEVHTPNTTTTNSSKSSATIITSTVMFIVLPVILSLL